MKTGPSIATQLSHKLLMLVVLSVSPLMAAPKPPILPPTPSVEALVYLVPTTTADVEIVGLALGAEAYDARQGNKLISGAFSNAGITINTITVNSATSLTLNISVAANSAVGGSTLTITNPDGNSATSAEAIVHITDVPVINGTQFIPESPSVIEDIDAIVTDFSNEDTTLAVSFSYQWFENEVAIAQTNSILPAAVTQQGSAYRCEITPSKLNGSILGATVSTAPAIITADKDGNGIHDQWEEDVLMETASDPQADSDGDGLSNRAEYIFGLDPNDANSNAPIVSSLNPNTGEFEYRRAALKLIGITYRIETSSDLVNWTEQTGASQSLSQANANSEVVKVGLSPALISANSKLFVRVSAD